MPLADLEFLLTAAKALKAEERIARIVDGQMASGWSRRGKVRQHMRSLEREVRGSIRGRGKPATRAELAAFGIEVKRG